MKSDPPRRRDGRCARPGCGKLVTPPKRPQKGVDPAVYALDPFHATECCRIYHGLDTSGRVRRTKFACSTCGCDLDERTPGCKACKQRHISRREYAAKGVAA